MGGSRTQTTVQNENHDPWAPAQPGLQNILAGATSAYNSGVGSQVYGGQRVAGFSSDSMDGLAALRDSASAGQGAAKAGDAYLTGLLSNGGSSADERAALAKLDGIGDIDTSRISGLADQMADPTNIAYATARRLTNGDYNLSTDGYTGLLDGLKGQTQSEKSLQDAADGRFLGGANPYLDAVIGRSQGEAASQIAQRMGAAGRGGSGRYAATIADSLGAIGTQMRYDDYSQERARQSAAAAQIDSSRNARTGVQEGLYRDINSAEQVDAGLATQGAGLYNSTNAAALGGATALAGVEGQNIANQTQRAGMALSAAQTDRSAAMAGLGMIGENISNLQSPGRTLAGVGAAEDQMAQSILDAQRDQFDETQASPWKQLGLYSQLVSPIAGLGGSGTTVGATRTPQPGVLQSLAGFGLAAGGTAARFMGSGR